MRKNIKKQLIEIFETLHEAHRSVNDLLNSGEYEDSLALLGECNNAAVQIGDTIEENEGEVPGIIQLLNDYCDSLYNVAVDASEGNVPNGSINELDTKLSVAQKSVENDIKIRQEIVFLPYNASMWDSLESVWKAADNDPDCDAYVIPIPYYEKNADGSLGKYHYEGELFPKYVPITHYSSYDLENRRPDKIYIHNPYDANNFITTVDPRYYSSELIRYTDELIYIPYFVLEDREEWDDAYLEFVEKYVLLPAVLNADKVIVQSENMRKIYIRTLLKYCGGSREDLLKYTDKILGTGSPKFEKIASRDYDIPENWLKVIEKPNGGKKKIVFYNTTIAPMIDLGEIMLNKIKEVLGIFYEFRDDIAILWRPHPLMNETVKGMHPEIYEEYIGVVDKYINDGWGIYDDSPDLDRAITLSDAYYGDSSSVVKLFEKTRKPIMLTNYL